MGFELGEKADNHSTTHGFVALAERVHFSEPQFPHLRNRDNSSTYIGLW